MESQVLRPDSPTIPGIRQSPVAAPKFRTPHRQLNVIRRRRLLQLGMIGWLTIDVAIAVLSVMLAYVISPHAVVGTVTGAYHVDLLPCALTYALCLGVASHILGLHDPRISRSFGSLAAVALLAVGMALSLLFLGWWLVFYLRVGRYVMFSMAVTSVVGMMAVRVLAHHGATNFSHAVCFLGDDRFCYKAAVLAEEYNLSEKFYTTLDFEGGSNERGGNVAHLPLDEWALERDVDQIVYDSTGYEIDDQQLLRCLENGLRVCTYSDFIEDKLMFVPVEQIDAKWMFMSRLDLTRPYYYGMKRVIEILLSIVGLVVLSPLLLLLMALIKLESRGAAIYSQTRVGQFNRHFKIYKLRTMVSNAEANGSQWAKKNDARITRLGKFLRKFRLDEVPQLWNVIRGDMSLIGPRPERPEFVEQLSEKIPFYAQRHLVMPGLTGWAQINYPYAASINDSIKKLMYDLYYIKRASLSLDLQILLRTIGAVAKGSR